MPPRRRTPPNEFRRRIADGQKPHVALHETLEGLRPLDRPALEAWVLARWPRGRRILAKRIEYTEALRRRGAAKRPT